VRFDLGEVRTISEIRWQFSSLEFADQFEIQVSSDRSTWETQFTGSNAEATPLPINISGRYVRFLFSNPNKDRQLGFLSEVNISSSAAGTGQDAAAAGDSSAREDKAKRRRR
jgi:F5/8 type C domain